MKPLKKIVGIMAGFVLLSATVAYGKIFEPSDIFSKLKPGDKLAIVMVHFGTTHDDTRDRTIDAVNRRVKALFPNVEVREAYTSRIIIKRLSDRGIRKHNPGEVFDKLSADGYTHLIVQPTTVINGLEMESLRRNAEALRSRFKEIRLGTPLLFFPEDYERVIALLTRDTKPEEAYLWVGHGTQDVSTAQYAMLDYMFKEHGHPFHVVGCIEGYPFYEQALKQLQAIGKKKLCLCPFMFVAGEHAKNDIAVSWKSRLEQEGYEVEILLRGLGEIPAVQDWYAEKVVFLTKHRRLDIMDKKSDYAVTGEKQE